MKVPAKINRIRRRIMHGITKNIGNSYRIPTNDHSKISDIKNILIIRPNHRLGNQLLLTPVVQEVINLFPHCHIDLFVKGGVAFPVFKNYKQIKKIIQLPKKPFEHLFTYLKVWFSIKQSSYDLVINADRNSSSGKLLTQLTKAPLKVFGDAFDRVEEQPSDHLHISKYPIYNLRHFLKSFDFKNISNDLPLLDIKLDDKEREAGKQILQQLVDNNKKTICLYTNATGRKCYSEDWWAAFYDRLQIVFSEYNIIEMLPVENISKLNFKAPHFYSQDIREMAAIISHAAIFIAADNGVMHLASASMTPTVGFFSVTNPQVYAPYGNGSLSLHTLQTNLDDWIEAIDKILNKG